MKKSIGVTMDVPTIRVTEMRGFLPGDQAILGETLVRKGIFKVTVSPVITTGRRMRYPDEGPVLATYTQPDTFNHFEFRLSYAWWNWRRWIPDRQLGRLLDHHCAVELWTVSEPLQVMGTGYPWVHWLFPSTSWLRNGRGSWEGRSYSDGARMIPEDYPGGEPPPTAGGFWKTATPPPTC